MYKTCGNIRLCYFSRIKYNNDVKHYGNHFKKFEISLLKSSDFKLYIENNK